MKEEIRLRSQVDPSLTWDLAMLFENEEAALTAQRRIQENAAALETRYKGKLKEPESIGRCLEEFRGVQEEIMRLGSYRHLTVAVDMTDNENQGKMVETMGVLSEVAGQISFVEPEILENPSPLLEEAAAGHAKSAHYLQELLREKPHRLSYEVEKMLASLSGVLSAPMSIYNKAKLQDMDFGSFEAKGEIHPLSFVLFENHYEYVTDLEVRRSAYEAFHKKLGDYENTVAAAYQTQVQKEKVLAKARGFDSVIDSLLFPQQVTRAMYDRQIDVIYRDLAPHIQKYARLLKSIHGLDEMTFSDLKLPVDPAYEPSISVEESKEYVFEGLKPMGEEYLDMVRRAYDERWIDFEQNKGKSTGAFCSSPYGAHPYILISWSERMREVFVLAHELGHAGHFYLSHQHQNLLDARPSLYFIEAPSTMNEMLMAQHLLKSSSDKVFRRWVLSSMVSRTYYHNFVTHLLEAHFQREVYRIIDAGGSLHAPRLNMLMRNTLEGFFGDSVRIPEGAERTWMRQPHYYMGLYPYTYSAGLTISTEMAKRVEQEGAKAVEDWTAVLKSGGTLSPVALAARAGIDITSEAPLKNTIRHIGALIDEIALLTEELER